MTNLLDIWKSLAPSPDAPPQQPGGWYSEEGDCAFFFISPEPHYAEYVDDVLTVYRALEGRHVVGAQIKGIKHLPDHDIGVVTFDGGPKKVKAISLMTYKLQEVSREKQGRPEGWNAPWFETMRALDRSPEFCLN